MGVSNRATRPLRPEAGDLLMPERRTGLNPVRRRDAEDACFETVSAPRDVFASRPAARTDGGVFKSRMTMPVAEDGPVPRDFAGRTSAAGERLGVFAGNPGTSKTSRLMSPLMTLAVMVCAVMAMAVFWMAGGHALVGEPGAGEPPARADAGPAPLREPVVLSPDPVVTSSTPANQSKPVAQGYSAPLPRPARIERAGSILMIRPAGG
ncbi:hypothetical protein ABWH89_05320 [Hoeflea alexandrii]|uniref:hypothetical protein n=1 Tax=Hoeflea alexandrii TaxID=288436 RepID=UPI0035D06296